VCVVCGCIGVLHAIFSAAAAVFVVVSLVSWVAIDVSGSSSTFFAHTYTIHGRHTGLYIYICMCVCQGQGCACVSLCRGNLLNETSSDLTNFKQIIYNTQRHRRHAHTHTHRQILRERHAHTQGTVVARKTAHRTPWWVVVVGGRITRRS